MALRVYRLAPRKARIEVCGTSVSLYLPAYFGRRRWQLDGTGLAVTDLTGLPESSVAGDDRAPARSGRPVLIPYLFTTSPLTVPNLLLQFTIPHAVPPLRLSAAVSPNTELPFGYWSSRGTTGCALHGVLLRAVDLAAAADRLRQAGAVVTDDPQAWLHARRRGTAEPT